MADISRYVRDVVNAIRGDARPAPRPAAASQPVPTTLTCPRCKQGTLVAGHRGWGCSRWREGCPFVIWFEIAGRRITDAELADLVSKGKTRKRKWRSGQGADVGGRLVLDLSAARDVGAARLDASGE
jgi:DNA topoisomerase-3